jgi:hypothetical protein
VRLSAAGVQKLLGRHRLGRRAQRVAALAQLTAATTAILTAQAKDGPFGFCHFATRYGIGALVAGDKSARDAAGFVDHVAERLAEIGAELTGVLTDNGPEFTGRQFTAAMAERDLRHHQIPPRSPNHNAVCERFQGTAPQEFYRPAFHRQHFAPLADLNAQSQGWLQHYNTRRRNHGDCMRGRTPLPSWRRTYHDQAEGPPVTSSCALEALDDDHRLGVGLKHPSGPPSVNPGRFITRHPRLVRPAMPMEAKQARRSG